MANVERSFAKLIGRQPTEREVENLHRVKDALGLKDNDALWLVLIALESYDSLFRKYPEMVSAEIQQSIRDQRAAIAAMAEAETRRALDTLAEAVARSSETVAGRLLESSRLQALGLAMFLMLAFGSFCTFLGYVLGSGRLPYWGNYIADAPFAVLIISAVARTPAGGIAVVAALALSLLAAWHARKEIRAHRRWDLVLTSCVMAVLSVLFAWSLI